MTLSRHAKQEIVLRTWLQAKDYHRALAAMEFARRYHVGKRKDGRTPVFSHFVEIAHLVRGVLPWLQVDPEDVFCVVFLHDVREDHDVEDATIRGLFGDVVADAVERLTKKFKGMVKPRTVYFEAIAQCPIASIVKGCDRIHNIQSMVGVFSLRKQREYAQEVGDDFLPMLKRARRTFTRQEPAYEVIAQFLRQQLQLLDVLHRAMSHLPEEAVV